MTAEEKGEQPCQGRGRSRGTSGETPRILNTNAQSIVKKVDKLACLAGDLDPDLILMTESWSSGGITNKFVSIDGYEVQTDLRMDREDKAQGRGGGLLVYTKIGVKVTKLDININFVQYCSFMINSVNIYLIYRSPNSPTQAGMKEVVKSAQKNSVLIGDFNLPDID